MIEIPTLETERLILRAPKFEDLEPMEGFFADPVRMNFWEVLSNAEMFGGLC